MRSLFHNRLSWAGAAIAAFGAAGILFFAVFDALGTGGNPYLGIFAWVVFPAIMLLGGATLGWGVVRERGRRRMAAWTSLPPLPIWDFNQAGTRRWLLITSVCVAVFLPLSAVGSYHAYEMSESVSFCGAACHTSMSPEHTAFFASPHSATKCVDCHVGPGPSGYVEAKASGVRRLWAAMTDSFPRPLLSPLQSLPHSKGTCASCHASDRLVGPKLKTFAHYGYDETNTARRIDLLLNVGGRQSTGEATGIHAHQSKHIEFAYLDSAFQTIPWVRVVDAQGVATEYRIEDPKITVAQADGAPRRTMDCVDCHNRSGHEFKTPDSAVNAALFEGRLNPNLPFLKKESVDVLGRTYTTTSQADATIEHEIAAYYTKAYPALASQQKEQIASAATELKRIYRSNIFPEMKASWETFPSNLGHYSSPGCFRCHGGNMKSADGRVIPKDCLTCHSVNGQTEGKATLAKLAKDFVHPVDMGDLKDATCTDCHTGRGIPQ